jgi:hypothetical protein
MKRPITLTIAAILVLVVILLSAVWPMVGGDRLLGLNSRPAGFGGRFANGNSPSGNFLQGTPSENSQSGTPSGNSPQGTPSGQPNGTQNGFAPNDQNGNGNRQGGQFGPGNGMRGSRGGMFGGGRILQYVLYAVEILLGLAAIIGLWLSKKWGAVLAIITSAVILIATLPGLFQFFNAVSLIESLLKIVLAIGIIVLVVIPYTKPVQPVAQ